MPVTGSTTEPPARRIGVLLVHGIGRQGPGDFLGQFRDTLSRVRGVRVEDVLRVDPATRKRTIRALQVEGSNGSSFLYEVHWEDVFSPELAKGAVDTALFLPLAWFPWFNKQAGLLGTDESSSAALRVRPASMATLLWLFWLGTVALTFVRRPSDAMNDLERIYRKVERPGYRFTVHDYNRFSRRGRFDSLLDDYIGDVVSYLMSVSGCRELRGDIALRIRGLRKLGQGAKDPSWYQVELDQEREKRTLLAQAAARVHDRFNDAAGAALADGCTELHVVGHSLGSVIAYHAMSGDGLRTAPADPTPTSVSAATLTRFITIGSPLQKFSHFWPGTVMPMTAAPVISARMAGPSTAVVRADAGFQWINLYSPLDLVSGSLRRFSRWGPIDEPALPGLGGVVTAHVAYAGNPQFTNLLASQLGLAADYRRSLAVRALGRLYAWAQLVAAVVIVAVVSLLGLLTILGQAVPLAAVLMIVWWVIAFAGRWLLPDWTPDWSGWKVFGWLVLVGGVGGSWKTVIGMPGWARGIAKRAVERRWAVLYRRREAMIKRAASGAEGP